MTVSTMTTDEAWGLLQRNHVARPAVTFHDQLEIAPVHYVFHEGCLYVRTSPGAKVQTLRQNPFAAVEVDEIDSLFAWRSVVVHGAVEVLEPGVHADRYEEALGHLGAVAPSPAEEGDSAAIARRVVLRIHVVEIQARKSGQP